MTDPFIPPPDQGPAGPRLSGRGLAALLGLGWFVVALVLVVMWLLGTIPIEVAIAVAIVVGIVDAAFIYLVGRARRE